MSQIGVEQDKAGLQGGGMNFRFLLMGRGEGTTKIKMNEDPREQHWLNY
jgi:hypothetical protein